jgi:hypothetical protein
VAGIVVLIWWQRNPLIEFLTPNKNHET